MRGKLLCVGLAFALLAGGTSESAANTEVGLDIFPLSKVKRGQKGYGLTTFQGTTPERFEFEVIGVNKNFLPKMDIILVKSDDPKLAVTGFWQGMSGSPMFIDGKLTCAFSYGFRFNKVAIGGCTPIQYMRQEGFRPPRRIESESDPRMPLTAADGRRVVAPRSAGTMKEWLELVPGGRIDAAMADRRSPWLMQGALPAAPKPADTERGMAPAAVPLALSGFSAPAFAQAKQLMSGFPLEPMAAGGTGSPNDGPTAFQPGGSIAVQLVRGDMSAAATGTVSLVEGPGVLAFGHPMFHAGEIYAPVAAAEVHTVIPSALSAFVVASPLRELGALVQDRQSTIAADTSLKVRMIPVQMRIRNGKKEIGRFSVEVLDNRFLSGTFSALAAMNAMSLYLPDRDHVTMKVHSRVELRGHEPIEFTDYLYSESGAGSAIGGARGLRVLVPLLMNPFAPIEIERVRLDIDVDYATNYGEIVGLRLPAAELSPGQKSYVDVELRRYDGDTIVERVPFRVPAHLEGSIVKLEVSSGDAASLDAAPPTTLPQLTAALRKLLPGTVYAVTLYTADEGAAIDGKLIRDLPASALDRLRRASSTTEMSVYRPMARSTFPAKRVLSGSADMLVKVAESD